MALGTDISPTGGVVSDGGRLKDAAREIARERDAIQRLAETIATPSDQGRLVDALSAHIERVIDHAGRLAAWREIVSTDGDILRASVEEIEASRRQIAGALQAFRGVRPIPAHAGAAEIFEEFLIVIQGIVETLDRREDSMSSSRTTDNRC